MKVGDYVRTKTGIHKVFKINENATVWKYYCDKKPTGEWDSSYEYIKIKDDDIIKSSPNIIDLIEVGDYVNGERVIALEKDVDKRNIYPSNVGAKIFTDYELQGNWYFGIQEEDIKSIVTKECFESMEYKVGD